MELKRFKEKNRKKESMILFTILCILLIGGVFFYSSFALFEVKENFNVIKGNVENPGDLYFAYYVDDEVTTEMPNKDSGYTISSKSSCTNGVTISFDEENWTTLVNYSNYKQETSSRTKCTLYFEESFSHAITSCGQNGKNAALCFLEHSEKSRELFYDETTDNNLRFVGKNPSNYVLFNGQMWRIVGVMNHMRTNESDNLESRLKLVRSEQIGNFSYDSSSFHDAYGNNNWHEADLMKLLNPGYENESVGGSLYFNASKGFCYTGRNHFSDACDFTTIGLTEEISKSMIAETTWNLGGVTNDKTWTVKNFYEKERGSEVSSERPTVWNGYVALIYASDYAYATNGGIYKSRLKCLEEPLYNWSLKENIDCRKNNWLQKSSSYYFLSHVYPTLSEVAAVYTSGKVNYNTAFLSNITFPSIYLKNNVKIISGDGSLYNPYILS